jgi:hypothetical protein
MDDGDQVLEPGDCLQALTEMSVSSFYHSILYTNMFCNKLPVFVSSLHQIDI